MSDKKPNWQPEVEYWSIADVVPSPTNARDHGEVQVDQIAASIREFGFVRPVLVDDEGNLIAGHGRMLGAQKLGLETVPVIKCPPSLTPEDREALAIADNQLALNSEWDTDFLRLNLAELNQSDDNFDFYSIGFSADELSFHLNLSEGLAEPSLDPGNVRAIGAGEPAQYFRWGATKVTMTDEEVTALHRCYEEYTQKFGSSYGFGKALAKGLLA